MALLAQGTLAPQVDLGSLTVGAAIGFAARWLSDQLGDWLKLRRSEDVERRRARREERTRWLHSLELVLDDLESLCVHQAAGARSSNSWRGSHRWGRAQIDEALGMVEIYDKAAADQVAGMIPVRCAEAVPILRGVKARVRKELESA